VTAVAEDRWARWLLERRHGGDAAALEETLRALVPIRDRVLDAATLQPGDTVLDVGCGDGLIGFGALERVGASGRVVFSDVSAELLDRCGEIAAGDERCRFVEASVTDLGEIESESVDVVTVRSVLIYVPDRAAAFAELHRVLRPGGRLSVFEPINSYAYPGPAEQWGPWNVEPVLDLAERVKDVFRAVHANEASSMHDFAAEDVLAWAEEAGFRELALDVNYTVVPPQPRPWAEVENVAANPLVPTLGEAIDEALDPDEAARFRAHLSAKVEAGEGLGRSAHAYLRAVR
jgi:ubiquinone/menaquinone biosynthesis C-methylase UbiE